MKLVRIKNTLVLSEIEVSEPLLEYVRQDPNMELCSDLYDIPFNENGNLF